MLKVCITQAFKIEVTWNTERLLIQIKKKKENNDKLWSHVVVGTFP